VVMMPGEEGEEIVGVEMEEIEVFLRICPHF
jgi:hypothetical protein